MPIALVVAIVGVIAGSLIIAGFLSTEFIQELQFGSNADASGMPLDVAEVFTSRQRGGDALGGTNYLRVDEGFVDDDNHCEFCIAMEYKPGPQGKALVAFTNVNPIDLSGANILTFAARGEEGGETLNIYVAGSKSKESPIDKDAAGSSGKAKGIKGVNFSSSDTITLGKSWQVYHIELNDVERSEVTHGFAFEVVKAKGNERQVVYLDSIFYSK
ncbi:MAG TPA: hypothetical protein VGQ03_00755 [Nitrososphaera sp.]|nr:hypothetical protein [Nitrososphaera sp.]